MYQSFEDLKVWQRGVDLAVDVYEATRGSRDFGLKDQMTRSAVSVPSNIAEGAERNSDKEFCRFIHIAKGSSAELRTQAIIAKRVGEMTEETADKIINETRAISRMLQSLADKVSSRIKP